jgi:hypothetical protein
VSCQVEKMSSGYIISRKQYGESRLRRLSLLHLKLIPLQQRVRRVRAYSDWENE